MPRVTLVTGYIELDQPWRRHNAYVAHGNQLMASGLPMVAFLDRNTSGLVVPSNVVEEPASLEECWLYPHTKNAQVPEGSRVGKETVAYSIVQHQKTEWLLKAAELTDADTLAWVDFGILHLATGPHACDLHIGHIVDWCMKLQQVPHAAIELPGYHVLPKEGGDLYNTDLWYVLGGLIVMPRSQVVWLHENMQALVTTWLQQDTRIRLEVAAFSRLAQLHPEKFLRWQAKFSSIFTAYDYAALTRFC